MTGRSRRVINSTRTTKDTGARTRLGSRTTCPGCWNADTWAFERRDLRSVDALAEEILATPGIEGVTFSGGEPFQQARALAALAARVQAAGLSVFIFSGHTLDALTAPAHRALLAHTDVLVAGPYDQRSRIPMASWRSSANQVTHFRSDRYGPADAERVPEAEVYVAADGTLRFTGFPDRGLLATPPA